MTHLTEQDRQRNWCACGHSVGWHHDSRGCGYHGFGEHRCACNMTCDEAVEAIVARHRAEAAREARSTESARWEQALTDAYPPPNCELRYDGSEDPVMSAYVDAWREVSQVIDHLTGDRATSPTCTCVSDGPLVHAIDCTWIAAQTGASDG